MKDDKIIIKDWHRKAAREIFNRIKDGILEKMTMTVGGESGAGKSEIAFALKEVLEENACPTGVLQQDDYFIYMSQVCDAMRRKNLDIVGPLEVKLDYLDSHLHAFKQGAQGIYKPVAIYQEARFEHEVMPLGDLRVLIAEGTYTSLLEFADKRVFIDASYHQTNKARTERARDLVDKFTAEILEREHRIIREHKARADFLVSLDGSVRTQPGEGRGGRG